MTTAPTTSPREQRPVTALRGVGDALAQRLAALGVRTVQDLLFLLPLRYEDRTHVVPIGALQAGTRAVVEGEVLLAEVAFRRRRQLLARISDGSGFLTLRFFYFSNAQQQGLARGTRIRCYGEVRRGPQGLEMVHPEYRRFSGDIEPMDDTLTPVYPMTEGVTQGRLRVLIDQALVELQNAGVRDWLPPEVLALSDAADATSLPSLAAALAYVHRPPRDAPVEALIAGQHPTQRRLAFEELLAHHLALKLLRAEATADPAAPLADAAGLEAKFIASLPFPLTGAQRRALDEVDTDLARSTPMTRLVQGDVGCGKTVVAAAAAARAIGSGHQAALMAPDRAARRAALSQPRQVVRPLGVTVVLVTGSQPARTRRSALELVASGEGQIVVGTHALFQEGIEFNDLALAIVDEQHRFGVQQRHAAGRERPAAASRHPHQLIMTATPIPRTLAMTAYADLDVSIIDALPPGRTPVKTVVAADSRRDEVVARIHAAVAQGRQAYWVCPLIEESEELEYQAAEETAAVLAEALPDVRVGLVHGRMPPRKKEEAMRAFQAGRSSCSSRRPSSKSASTCRTRR
jgi:ATP-dependent DNA helicase RecG